MKLSVKLAEQFGQKFTDMADSVNKNLLSDTGALITTMDFTVLIGLVVSCVEDKKEGRTVAWRALVQWLTYLRNDSGLQPQDGEQLFSISQGSFRSFLPLCEEIVNCTRALAHQRQGDTPPRGQPPNHRSPQRATGR